MKAIAIITASRFEFYKKVMSKVDGESPLLRHSKSIESRDCIFFLVNRLEDLAGKELNSIIVDERSKDQIINFHELVYAARSRIIMNF